MKLIYLGRKIARRIFRPSTINILFSTKRWPRVAVDTTAGVSGCSRGLSRAAAQDGKLRERGLARTRACLGRRGAVSATLESLRTSCTEKLQQHARVSCTHAEPAILRAHRDQPEGRNPNDTCEGGHHGPTGHNASSAKSGEQSQAAAHLR